MDGYRERVTESLMAVLRRRCRRDGMYMQVLTISGVPFRARHPVDGIYQSCAKPSRVLLTLTPAESRWHHPLYPKLINATKAQGSAVQSKKVWVLALS